MKGADTRRLRRNRFWTHSATILATGMLASGLATAAQAQDAPPPPASGTDDPASEAADEIIVTGFRASLQNSTNAKRENVGFTDSVSAEDIGQFPDTNLAEAFNRVPGITIAREVSGEGLNIAIRGLGTNFTRILMNGAPIAVASTGRTDAQSTNREVDLDLFPTELFTRLTVYKSPLASMLEGGAAGVVDIRSARPFDTPGFRLSYGIEGAVNNNDGDDWGGRAHLLVSNTFGNFGILAGVALLRQEVNVRGFETIGWTNPNLSAAQCGAATGCNTTGGGNFTIPGTVPANAGNGLIPGTVIDRDFLLAQNPGASITQIDNGLIPRLGRPMFENGTRDRISAILAMEWRPSDNLRFYVDGMYAHRENDLERVDMNLVGRNGAIIPLNTEFDRSDCAQGCVVTRSTFANAQFFLEYRPFLETIEYYGVNPGLEWQITPDLRLDIQGNYTRSDFRRESPTVLVNTPASSGVTVEYTNDGTIPTFDTNVDLNDPANFVWAGGRVNIQREERETETKGARFNLTWGDREFNIRIGGAYDDVMRRIRAFDNSQAWQNAVCGNNPSVFLPAPNTQPQCRGLDAPGGAAPGDPTYPGFGTGFTAGQTGPVNYLGSLIPQSALAGYLRPTEFGFVTVDWRRFAADSNYAAFNAAAPEAGSSNTGASGGLVREETIGAYAEVNGDTYVGRHRFRYNFGLRYIHTDQTIGGIVSLSDPRNAQDPDGAGPLPPTCPGTGNARDGSCFPNIVNFVETQNAYENWLPSGNIAFNIFEDVVARVALSRTMTRPNPNAMLPGVNFSTPSADVANIGNPALEPFISDNIDVGLEWYTGGEGYVAVTGFRKRLTGFTVNGTTTQPFAFLAQYGITFDTLTPTQQAAINARGGPGAATVVIQQQVNASGVLAVDGLELSWVQPLDFILGRWFGINGFGFSANATFIDQDGSGAAPAVATGVAPRTYNGTIYYENHGVSLRMSGNYTAGSVASGSNQNGIPAASLFNAPYEQWDFAGRFNLGEILGNRFLPELTVDVINVFEAEQRQYFQFENAPFTVYQPGRTILVGLRGRF